MSDDLAPWSGYLSEQEVYTITAEPALKQFTGILLETLPHPQLPRGNSGRHPRSGNFLISDFRLQMQDELNAVAIGIGRLASDFPSTDGNTSHVENMLGRGPANHWSGWPHMDYPHRVVFELEKPTTIPQDGKLQITIDCRDPEWRQYAFGCFRLSVSDSPTPFFDEQRRLAFWKIDAPFERLAGAGTGAVVVGSRTRIMPKPTLVV